MLPAFLLAVIGLTTPNPTSVGQEGRVTRSPKASRGLHAIHSSLVSDCGRWRIWGDVASFIFFGVFAVTALAGWRSDRLFRSA